MSLKLFLKAVSALYAAKALFGLVYFIYGWKAWIASWMMPSWLMLVAIVVDSLLAYWAFKFAKGKK